MVEPDPVADLMSCSASQVVRLRSTSRKRRVEKNDSVILGLALVFAREGGITEGIVAETDGVEVQRSGVSLSESVLHFGLLAVTYISPVEPDGIQVPGDLRQFETKTSFAVIPIQDFDLFPDLGISKMYVQVRTAQQNRPSNLRDVTSGEGLIGIDNVDVD